MENKIKYPRSYHLHYSEKLSSKDDRYHKNDDHFVGKSVVVSLKMDGENTTVANKYSHARSLDSLIDSEDRRWVENFRNTVINNKLGDNQRICGENLFYRHTCVYNNLLDMFYTFSIWDGEECLSWVDTKQICDGLGIKTVPVIYEGIYDREKILESFESHLSDSVDDVEGFVVRNAEGFHYDDFKYNLSKYVRRSFEIPSQHWRYSKKTINKLHNNENPWNLKLI